MKRRTDANQAEIVWTLERAGAVVIPLCELAGREPRAEGCPDLLVAYGGNLLLMEVKTKTGKLSRVQREFLSKLPAPWAVVRSPDEALQALGLLPRRECPSHPESVNGDCPICQQVWLNVMRENGGQPRKFKFRRYRCPDCGAEVAANWYIRHRRSECRVGGKAL